MNKKVSRRSGSRLLSILVMVMAAAFWLCGCGEQEIGALSPVVCIDLGAGRASGVIFERTEEELVIVTAAHVLEGLADNTSVGTKSESSEEAGTPAQVKIIFSEQTTEGSADSVPQHVQQFPLETLECFLSETSETAFLSIPLDSVPEEIREKCRAAARDKQRFDRLTEGAAVTLKGFSSDGGLLEIGGTLLYSWIYAEDFEQYMMLVGAETFPGMSGGGAFDETDNFVGALCGVNEAGETAAVPLSIILAEYARFFP